MPSQTITLAALLALSTTISAQFTMVLGGDNGNCDGTALQGYCCPGSILASGDYGNNNKNDVSGLICCVGDTDQSFNNIAGVTTCSAGTATPLTAVSGAATGAGSATASSSDAETTESSEATTTSSASITSSEGMTSSGMTTSMSTTGGGAASRTSSGSAAAQSSSSSSSSAGAARAIVTGAPILGGAALGMLALL